MLSLSNVKPSLSLMYVLMTIKEYWVAARSAVVRLHTLCEDSHSGGLRISKGHCDFPSHCKRPNVSLYIVRRLGYCRKGEGPC